MTANRSPLVGTALLVAAVFVTACASDSGARSSSSENPAESEPSAVIVHYLEIVTPDVDATCRALGVVHDVEFGAPEQDLGNARTAQLASGGRIGVRAPMRESETPVVRPYLRVDDIEAAVADVEAAGCEIAMGPTEMPGQGRFAIYIRGGIEHGLWQP